MVCGRIGPRESDYVETNIQPTSAAKKEGTNFGHNGFLHASLEK